MSKKTALLTGIRVEKNCFETGFELWITLDFSNDRHHLVCIRQPATADVVAGYLRELAYNIKSDPHLLNNPNER